MKPSIFRGSSGIIGLVIAAVLVVWLFVDAVVRGGWATALLLTPWLLLIVWFVYVVMYASHIAVGTAGVTVQNLLRIVWIPWARVADVTMRYQVVFALDDGAEVKAFGGPVAGRPARPRTKSDLDDGRRQPPAVRDVELIREAWERALTQGAQPGEVTRSWDRLGLISLAIIVVWAVSAVMITGLPA